MGFLIIQYITLPFHKCQFHYPSKNRNNILNVSSACSLFCPCPC